MFRPSHQSAEPIVEAGDLDNRHRADHLAARLIGGLALGFVASLIWPRGWKR